MVRTRPWCRAGVRVAEREVGTVSIGKPDVHEDNVRFGVEHRKRLGACPRQPLCARPVRMFLTKAFQVLAAQSSSPADFSRSCTLPSPASLQRGRIIRRTRFAAPVHVRFPSPVAAPAVVGCARRAPYRRGSGSSRRARTADRGVGRSAGLNIAAVLDINEGALVVEYVVSVREEVAARCILALVEPDGDAVGVTFPDE